MCVCSFTAFHHIKLFLWNSMVDLLTLKVFFFHAELLPFSSMSFFFKQTDKGWSEGEPGVCLVHPYKHRQVDDCNP